MGEFANTVASVPSPERFTTTGTQICDWQADIGEKDFIDQLRLTGYVAFVFCG